LYYITSLFHYIPYGIWILGVLIVSFCKFHEDIVFYWDIFQRTPTWLRLQQQIFGAGEQREAEEAAERQRLLQNDFHDLGLDA